MATYWEKLKDPRWQKKRLEVLGLADWACARCGSSDKELHVHHSYYQKDVEPWDYSLSSLTALCAECHAKANKLRVALRGTIGCQPLEIQGLLFALVVAMEDCSYGDTLSLLERFILEAKAVSESGLAGDCLA